MYKVDRLLTGLTALQIGTTVLDGIKKNTSINHISKYENAIRH